MVGSRRVKVQSKSLSLFARMSVDVRLFASVFAVIYTITSEQMLITLDSCFLHRTAQSWPEGVGRGKSVVLFCDMQLHPCLNIHLHQTASGLLKDVCSLQSSLTEFRKLLSGQHNISATAKTSGHDFYFSMLGQIVL